MFKRYAILSGAIASLTLATSCFNSSKFRGSSSRGTNDTQPAPETPPDGGNGDSPVDPNNPNNPVDPNNPTNPVDPNNPNNPVDPNNPNNPVDPNNPNIPGETPGDDGLPKPNPTLPPPFPPGSPLPKPVPTTPIQEGTPYQKPTPTVTLPASKPTPPTKPPIHQEPLVLRVVERTYEAWFKNCLYVENYSQTGAKLDDQRVGCNKDENLLGRIVPIRATEGCNHLRLRMETYELTPQGSQQCVARQHEPGFVCNGPYKTTPTRVRYSPNDPEYFKIYDARTISNHDHRIEVQGWSAANWQAIEREAWANSNAEKNRWVISFFEDQPTLTGAGIDFNDFIVDLDGQNVNFTVDGATNLSCVAQ